MKKSNNDKIILDLKKEVEQKKSLLKTTGKFSPKTNCMLILGAEKFNINVLDKESLLFLIAKLQSYKSGLLEVLPQETLEIAGFSVNLWVEDLTNKFNNLNRKLEEERLKKLEDKLHSLLSLDTKVELEIEDLKNQI